MTKLVNKLTYLPFSKEVVLSLPDTPGVYIFCDKNKKPLYIGKSVSIKSRVYSYLSNSLFGNSDKWALSDSSCSKKRVLSSSCCASK